MDTRILEEFGLTKNEIAIFIVLVKKGLLSATAIAKETGLNRPYIYYALERLLEKGYISEIKIKGKRNFKIIPLNDILTLESHKLAILNTFIKEIKQLENKEVENISVEVLKGEHVIINVFKRIVNEIKPKEKIYYLGLKEDIMEEKEPLYLKKFLNYFRKNKITEKIIIAKGGKKLSYAKTSKYKHLDKKLIGNTAKIIYQNTTIELIYEDPIYAIIIKSRNFTDREKNQFEIFWEMAKP